MADVITLNEIEYIKNLLANDNSIMTSKVDAIKSVVDTINGNVNTIKTNTATNNTGSKTGVLSSKLSYLITQNENHGSYEKTTSGTYTWTAPSGVYFVYCVISGGSGGGGGGGCTDIDQNYEACKGGAGGGGGGVSDIVTGIVPVTPGLSYTLTVGSGGAGGAAGTSSSYNGGNGGTGGNSSIGNLISVPGGIGGTGGQGAENGSNNAGSGGANVVYNGKAIFMNIKQPIYNSQNGSPGTVGFHQGSYNSYYYPVYGSGGYGATNGIISGGAGGNGRGQKNYSTSSYDYSSDFPAAAGSPGSPGYIKIIW